MILMNVYFLETNRSYDFKVDEQTAAGQAIQEMVALIAQKEHLTLEKDPGLFLLCSQENRQIFSPAASLAENGARPGDTLLLV